MKRLLYLLANLLQPDKMARFFKGRRSAVVLLYHDPSPDCFRTHVEYFRKHYNFIDLDTLLTAVHTKNWTGIPKNALVITFDDGHVGNYALLDVFKEYKLRPTIYLCTSIIGTAKKFWWMLVPPNRWEDLKKMEQQKRIKEVEKYTAFPDSSDNAALSFDMISEMSEFVDFDSHTRTHPILTTIVNDEFLKNEILGAKEDLFEIGITSKNFAYPNGDYTKREIECLKTSRYLSGRTTNAGWVCLNSDPYQLRIMGVSDDARIEKLKWQLSGVFGWALHLYKSGNLKGLKKPIVIE